MDFPTMSDLAWNAVQTERQRNTELRELFDALLERVEQLERGRRSLSAQQEKEVEEIVRRALANV